MEDNNYGNAYGSGVQQQPNQNAYNGGSAGYDSTYNYGNSGSYGNPGNYENSGNYGNPGGMGSWNSSQPPQKKSKKKLAVILGSVAGAVVILVILGVIFLPEILISDKARVFAALTELGEGMTAHNPASVSSALNSEARDKKFLEESMELSVKLELEDCPSELEEDMMMSISGLTMDLDVRRDMSSKTMSGSMGFGYLGTDLFSMGLYGTEEDFCLSLPELFEGYIRLPAENIISAYNQSVFGQESPVDEDMDFSLNLFRAPQEDPETAKLLTRLSADTAALYESITVEKADSSREFTMDGKTVSAKKYVMTVPRDSYMTIVHHFLDAMAESEDLMDQYGVETSDIDDARDALEGALANDIYVNVYLVGGKKVACVEAETDLVNEENGDVIETFMNVDFADSRAYNQTYEGSLSLTSGVEEVSADFVKTTDISGDRASSQFALYFSVGEDQIDYVFSASYDKKAGDYSYDISLTAEGDTVECGINGYVNDIVKDTSYDLGIDDMYVEVDGQRFGFSGNISAGPMTGTVETLEGPEYDILSMSENEVMDWMTEVQNNLYELLMSMYGY